MNNHSSKELFLVSILGVVVGGTATAFLMSKEGRKLRRNLEGTYSKVRENIDDVIHSIEKTVENGFDEKSEEWSEWVKDSIENIKEKVESIDLSQPKDLGLVLLAFTLLGAVLVVGTNMITHSKDKNGNMLHNIATHISTAQPIISELFTHINGSPKSPSGHYSKAHKSNEFLQFAVLGLKLWDTIKQHK